MRNWRDMAVKVAFIYAAGALAWVVGSDFLVSRLPAEWFATLQSIKGILFVVVTAGVLYIVVERLGERMQREALSASSVERMLGQVVTSVPIGIVLTSDDGTVTFLNREAEEMVGLRANEAVGRFVDDVCCADGAHSVAMLGELMSAGSVDEIAIGGRGGEQARRVLARAAQIDPGVPASGWIIALADISHAQIAAAETEARAQACRFLALALEACVRASDERALLRRIAETAVASGRYAAAWAVIRSDGGFEDVALVDMGARTREVAAYLHESARAGREMPSWSATADTTIVVSNDLARDPANIWHPAALEDHFGSVGNLIVKLSGTVVGSIGLFAAEPGAFDSQEIEILDTLLNETSFTIGKLKLERQRLDAEQEMEYSERGYRALFENHPAPMWVYDLETLAFLEVNDAAIAKYGYGREEFAAMTLKDIRPPEDVPRLMANVTQVTPGFEDAGVWTHRDKSGRDFPVHVYSHTVDWDGRQAELVMVLEVARVE